MQTYYGTKRIQARPMNRLDYNLYRGWELPSDENGEDEGYLVEYLDGGKPNVVGHQGYVSWSPKEQFEKAYQPLNSLSFCHALEALKAGERVSRAGWNGKNMWLVLVTSANYAVDAVRSGSHCVRPFIGMKTANDEFVPWVASQSDMLANDWQVEV
jgi:hypothetical protein